jgi:hypothetical protein
VSLPRSKTRFTKEHGCRADLLDDSSELGHERHARRQLFSIQPGHDVVLFQMPGNRPHRISVQSVIGQEDIEGRHWRRRPACGPYRPRIRYSPEWQDLGHSTDEPLDIFIKEAVPNTHGKLVAKSAEIGGKAHRYRNSRQQHRDYMQLLPLQSGTDCEPDSMPRIVEPAPVRVRACRPLFVDNNNGYLTPLYHCNDIVGRRCLVRLMGFKNLSRKGPFEAAPDLCRRWAGLALGAHPYILERHSHLIPQGIVRRAYRYREY